MKHWIVPLMVALLAVGTAQADNDKDKGKQKDQYEGQHQGQYDGQYQGQHDGKYEDQHNSQYKDGQNHGQVVSECNHQANQRNLKGQDRKDYTEWCQSRGGRYQYDYNRYGSEKTCYQRANNKGLKGDKRANFLDKCFAGDIGKQNRD